MKLWTETEETLQACRLSPEEPWPGLWPFSETDQAFFRGRSRETEELQRLVLRERLTVLYGLSGLGKTSLLRAGLFPRLRQNQILPIRIQFDFSAPRPDLAAQVKQAILSEAAEAEVEAPAVREGETLWEYFHRKDSDFWNRQNRLIIPLLVFDQFDELFTLGRQDEGRRRASREFLDELVDLAEGRAPESVRNRLEESSEESLSFCYDRHPYKILLSVREDFLPEVHGLGQRMRSIGNGLFRLSRLDGEAALEVVDQSPQLLDRELAERLVRFVAARGDQNVPLRRLEVEPALLSVFCRELNQRRLERGQERLTAPLLEESQEEILCDFYEKSMEGLSPAVRMFVEERLLTASGHRDSVALENVEANPEIDEREIQVLLQGRLLRIEDRAGLPRLELTHDLLSEVIRESRDRRRQREVETLERQARIKAEAGEREVRRQLTRTRVATLALLVLLAALVGLIFFGYNARNDGLRAWARVKVIGARHLLNEDGAPAHALAHLARAIQGDPDNNPATRAMTLDLLLKMRRPILRLPHDGPVLSVAASRDGKWYATGAQNGVVRVWGADGRPVCELKGLSDAVNSTAFSFDSRYLGAASKEGKAMLWRITPGTPETCLPLPELAHDSSIRKIAFSPLGDLVATASDDGSARVWRIETGESVAARHKDWVRSVQFSPDGQMLVTASDDFTAEIWKLPSAGDLAPPEAHAVLAASSKCTEPATQGPLLSVSQVPNLRDDSCNWVRSAVFSPDGKLVLTGSDDTWARLWRVRDGKLVKSLKHNDFVRSVTFSRDGSRFATASDAVQVWEKAGGDWILLARLDLPGGHVHSVDFSPDGKLLLAGADGGQATVYDIAGQKPVGLGVLHEGDVTEAIFAADGRAVLSASSGGCLLWSFGQRPSLPIFPGGKPAWRAKPVFSPEGDRVMLALRDGSVAAWDSRSGEPIEVKRRVAPGGVRMAESNRDGSVFAAIDEDGALWISPVTLQEPLKVANVKVELLGLSGNRVLALTKKDDPGDNGSSPWLGWSVVGGEPKSTTSADGFPKDVGQLALGAGGRSALIGVRMRKRVSVKVLDGWRREPRELALRDGLDCSTLSLDGAHAATAYGNSGQIYDLSKMEALGSPIRHENQIRSLDFSPDGSLLASASDDKTVRVWEVQTGDLVLGLEHDSGVQSAAFSPDGARLATLDENGVIRIWDVLVPGDTLEEWAEAAAGYRVSEQGTLAPLADQADRLARLRKLGGRDAASFDAWFLRPLDLRTIAPGSTLGVREYLHRCRQGGIGAEAALAFPGHETTQ